MVSIYSAAVGCYSVHFFKPYGFYSTAIGKLILKKISKYTHLKI